MLKAYTTDHSSDKLIIKFPKDNDKEEGIQKQSGDIYRLIEVSDSRILSALENGNNLWIRGGNGDDAVLCTDSDTFLLRELVTSNMFLVVEKTKKSDYELNDLETNGTHKNEDLIGMVVGRPSTTLEVTHLVRAPGIDQLFAALHENPFEGGDDDAFKGNHLLHVTKLYESIQASNLEIETFLKSQGALVIQGKHLTCRFFELFFNTAILEDWNLLEEPLDINQILSIFSQYEDEFSRSLTAFIISHYSDESLKFDSVKVLRFFAQQFLSARPFWDLDDFLLVWNKSCSELFQPDLKYINDMILIDKHPGSGRMEIRKYLRTDLPSDVESRFITLFKTKPRWQYEDLVPFIQDLGKDTKELDAIIIKHGRVSTTNNVRFITPRSQILD